MEIINECGLESAWMVSQINPPAFALTVVVKGTFQLRHGQPAILADEQLPVTGNLHEGNDPEKPLRYPIDFVPFKPRADVLLLGTCHSRMGRPTYSESVSVRVGPLSKSLVVTGDRVWTSRTAAARPQPFVSMPLTWDRTFGGPGFDRNPLGKGFDANKLPNASTIHPLPNIESPGVTLRNWSEIEESVGFGPIPEMWPQRLRKFGSLNDRYLKERWPWYPHDFDWGFFNAAPDDQQIEGYLKGDEEIILENLHPTIPEYHARLPGLRVRVFVNEYVRGWDEIREFPMHLDTIWLDMDTEQIVLVWRGNGPVRTEKLQEIFHCFVATEQISQGPASVEYHRTLLYETLDRREDEDDEDFEEEELEEEDVEDDVLEEEEVPAEEPAAVAEAEAEPSQETLPTGLTFTPVAVDEDVEEPEETDEPEEETESSDDEVEISVERVKEMIALRLSFENCDLTGLNLIGLDFNGLNMRGAVLEDAELFQTNLRGADLEGAVLTRANLREADCSGANFTEADLTEASLVQADLSGANLTGADLTRSHLRQANLREATAAEAIFVEADLSDANLEHADLSGADLCESRLHRTNVSHANLSDAALEKAWGRQLKAIGAILHKLRAADAQLCGANFAESSGDESVWQFANLYAANFTGVRLNNAEFSGACLEEAVFEAATLKEGRFNEANLRGARMSRCNLYETSLSKANLSDSDLSEANLFGATLMDAVIVKTNFTGANLRRIKNRQEIK